MRARISPVKREFSASFSSQRLARSDPLVEAMPDLRLSKRVATLATFFFERNTKNVELFQNRLPDRQPDYRSDGNLLPFAGLQIADSTYDLSSARFLVWNNPSSASYQSMHFASFL